MSDTSDVADVLVIGSGPSGAVISYTLATRGFKVVCLEQGDWVNPSDFPANHPEWELLVQHQWAHDPNIRQLPSDYPLDNRDSDMTPVMFNAVGGSSIYYGAEWPRLIPSDFRVRTVDGVADDWPITYADLEPYYTEMDEFLGVAGVGGDPAYPPGLDYPLPPHPLGPSGRKSAKAFNDLGWHWWPGSNAIPTHRFKHLNQCARWGMCEWGCPEGAKSSFDLAVWPHALKAGATVITGARVRRIETKAKGLADSVLYLDSEGREHRQRAQVVVLCANGIGTPRLLLLSDSSSHPDGLANSSGLVGKNLMLHPNCTSLGFYEDDMKSHLGPAGQLMYSLEFAETQRDRGFVRGSKLQLVPTPGPMNAINARSRLPFDELWGENFHQVVRTAEHGALWAANIEDLPEESNRVTLSKDVVDGSGIPAPKIEYRISENSWKSLRFSLERMEELHRAAGATEIYSQELWIDQPGHLLGTARMGDDPSRSVVDAFGRSHDVPNLFVADGSLFVTGGNANPTASITALALRVGKGIAENASNQAVPA